MPETVREKERMRLERMRAQLEIERSSFLGHWRDLADYILPRRAQFTINDVNRGDRRNTKIIDSTATVASRTLQAGMMAGVTSPSRPWFMLTVPDPDLADFGPVKRWLNIVTQRMRSVFLRSNLYNSLPTVYQDLGVFSTSSMFIEEDLTGDVIRTFPFPIGSYYMSQDERRAVSVFVREFQMTVRQLIRQFGVNPLNPSGGIDWERFSSHVKDLWDRGERESWIQVVHFIEPNDDWDPRKVGPEFKRFRSLYYERGLGHSNSVGISTYLQGDFNKFLSQGGFDIFPILAPRWGVTGYDVYGTTCPGMEALGDIKQLQLGEKRIFQAIEKTINPPLKGPSALRTTKTSILPGDITYTDEREGQRGFTPVYQIDPRINEMELKQQQIRDRINRVFYADLFLMLANSTRRQITAREIEERHEEKLLALGPVLEQLNADLLDPLIDNTFVYMDRQGLIPEPPQELQGEDLKVEYVSIMAQAQKIVGVGGTERFVAFVGEMAKVNPEVVDKLNSDQTVDRYGDQVGVDPEIIRTDEEVQEIREARAQAQQQAEQAAAAQEAAKTVKSLSDSKLEDDSALKRLIDQANAGNLGQPV